MGGGRGGGYERDNGSQLERNIRGLESRFPRSKSGYFGEPGASRDVRRIRSKNPRKAAENFFRSARRGSEKVEKIKPGVQRAKFRDGSHVVYRKSSSSDGSPVVEIITRNSRGLKRQKIHFIEEGK
jgi:hypothetical protein